MWPFKKNGQNTDKALADTERYAKLLNRFVEIDAEISTIKSKVANLRLDVDNLTGKLSKKLRDLQAEHSETQKEKDLNDDGLKYL